MQHVPVCTHTRRSWSTEKYPRYSWNLLFRHIRKTIMMCLSNSMTSSPCRTFGRYITRNPFIDENPNCPTAMLCPISYYTIFMRAVCISLYIPIIRCFIFYTVLSQRIVRQIVRNSHRRRKGKRYQITVRKQISVQTQSETGIMKFNIPIIL